MSLSRYSSTGKVERLEAIERSSSTKSRRSIRSMRSSSDSNSSVATLQPKHRHNDYSCYIHIINKTETSLQLVNSKAISGKWAPGSPPQKVESYARTLIELTDPKGPHGSEGWCSFRLHHPNKTNAVTFTLKFGDPYWARDDNFLNAYTSYPEWIKLNVLKYETSGHPFIAYVEVDFAEGKVVSGRKHHEIADEEMSQSSRSSEDDSLPEYDFNINNPYEVGKKPMPTIHIVDADSEADQLIHEKTDSAVALVCPDETEDKFGHSGDGESLVENVHLESDAQTQVIAEQWPEEMVENHPMESIEEEPTEQASDECKSLQGIETVLLESVAQPTTQMPEDVVENQAAVDTEESPVEPTPEIKNETSIVQAVKEAHELPQEPVSELFPQAAEHTTPAFQDEESIESDEREIQPTEEAANPQYLIPEIPTERTKEPEVVEEQLPPTPPPTPVPQPIPETSEHQVKQLTTPSDHEDEMKEDEYIRVNESKFESSQLLPVVARNSEITWSVFTSQKARMGIVAIVFLATWGFTATKVSGGLMGRVVRR